MDTPQRPTIITVICVLGFLGAAMSVLAFLSPIMQALGSFYMGWMFVSVLVGLACMIGMWKMKKWSVLLYTTMLAANQVFMLAKGVWSPMSLLIPLVVVGIGWANISKMN